MEDFEHLCYYNFTDTQGDELFYLIYDKYLNDELILLFEKYYLNLLTLNNDTFDFDIIQERRDYIIKIIEDYYERIKEEKKYHHRRKIAGHKILKLKSEVFKIHGESCLNCGSIDNIAIDHIVSVKNGGSNSIDNLQPLCRACNSSKGSKNIDYRKVKL